MVTGVNHDIVAQRLDSIGNQVGPILAVASGSHDQVDPAVAMDAVGNFVVTWTEWNSSTDLDIRAQRFAANGAVRGISISVATTPAKIEKHASVGMDATGNFAVAWTDVAAGNNYNVRGRRFAANGLPIGVSFSVASSSAAEYEPSLAMAADGRFAVAFVLDNFLSQDVRLQRFTAAGALSGASMTVANNIWNVGSPDLAMDDSGNGVVVWSQQTNILDSHNIMARRFTSGGSQGATLTVADTWEDLWQPTVAIQRTGGGFVVGHRANLSSHEIVTEVSATNQVLAVHDLGDGLTGLALSMDASGNYFATYEDFSTHTGRGRVGHLA